jgi:ABC-2 type transport system ATP-binding protein
MASKETLFELRNVQKSYGQLRALDGVTLEMAPASIGLLGPNGAGKSTLIKVLLGLLALDGGTADVLGFSLPNGARDIRRLIGYMPESDCFLPEMTAVEYVCYWGRLSGLPRAQAFRRAHEVLYYVGLGEARYRALGGFSTGMKQRAKLAQALVHGPRLVFLDEPTNGLDPPGRQDMLSLIEDVKSRGVDVVLSSHLLVDVERICESVVVLNGGKLIYDGAIDVLTRDAENLLEIDTKNANERFAEILRARGVAVELGRHLMVKRPLDLSRNEILALALENDIQIRHFMPREFTLETAFLGLMGEVD